MAAVLLAGAVAPALAKKPKIVFSIDGKGYKYKGRYVVASTSGVGTIVIGTKPARPGKILRTLGFGCAYLLPNETFPLVADPQACNANFTEQKIGGSFETKGWLAVSGVAVTFESFDGTWLAGTMSGVLDPLTGTDAPVTVEATFKVKVAGAE
jgi:hypothetical protein